MAQWDHIVDDVIEDKSIEPHRFEVSVLPMDQIMGFKVRAVMTVKNSGRTVCEVNCTFEIKNPIISTAIVVAAAKVYGVCVAAHIAESIGEHSADSYRESKKEKQEIGWWDRITDTTKRLQGKGEPLKEDARKALLACLKKLKNTVVRSKTKRKELPPPADDSNDGDEDDI